MNQINDKNYYEPDLVFMNKTKFIINNKTYYHWDLDDDVDDVKEQVISNFINLFVNKCTQKDHKLIIDNDYYIRIFYYTEGCDTKSCFYVCLRSIEDCSYKNQLLSLKSEKLLSCELIFDDEKLFYKFPITEWNQKHIKNIVELYMI